MSETMHYIEYYRPDFQTMFDVYQHCVHEMNVEKGFWEDDRSDGESIALIHSELSEALEKLRHGDPPDDKIPEFRSSEAELADTIIRIMDFAGRKDLDISGAIYEKLKYNATRPYKHGKEF